LGAPNSEKDFKREAHLAEVARLYRRKHTQTQIAALLGTTQQSISRDIAILKERWRAESVHEVGEVQREILANLEAIEEEAWEAWRRSREDAEKVVERLPRSEEESADADPKTGFIKERTMASQYGDPRFLEQVRKIQEDRAKIYGVNAPTKVAPTNPDGTKEFSGASTAELIAELQSINRALGAESGDTSDIERAGGGSPVEAGADP
jgi:predicted transcriptional regulator